jgi:hypothetical protein
MDPDSDSQQRFPVPKWFHRYEYILCRTMHTSWITRYTFTFLGGVWPQTCCLTGALRYMSRKECWNRIFCVSGSGIWSIPRFFILRPKGKESLGYASIPTERSSLQQRRLFSFLWMIVVFLSPDSPTQLNPTQIRIHNTDIKIFLLQVVLGTSSPQLLQLIVGAREPNIWDLISGTLINIIENSLNSLNSSCLWTIDN